MKSKFVIACLLLVSIGAWSAPARPGWHTHQMADGSLVEVQLVGDEYEHYLVTRDGQVVEEAPEGMRVTARRASAKPQRAPQSEIGKANPVPRGLVILAGFNDLPFSNDSASMWDMLNKPGYDYNGATGSIRDYFIAQSNGKYTPQFDVAGPIKLSKNRNYYGANSGGSDNMTRVQEMIKEACNTVDHYIDFTQYVSGAHPDTIDFVFIIFAGSGENYDGGDPNAIWPKRSTMASMTVKLENKTLYDFGCADEIDGYSGERNGIGTFCHEFGHIIGFPDYYATNGYNTNKYLTPGGWSPMDQGCYNNNCNTPANYSLFDKYFMGWLTPHVLSKDAKLNVTMGTDYEDGYMLTKSGTLEQYTCTDTVYYIENRQNIGWDAFLPGHGMLVWQVKYNSTEWKKSPNDERDHPHYTVVSAKPNAPIGCNPKCNKVEDGVCVEAEYSDYNTFPGSANVTEYTKRPGYAITDIAEADGKITFKLNGGDPSTGVQSTDRSTDRVQTEKLLQDGQMMIRRGESVYSLTGTRIQ